MAAEIKSVELPSGVTLQYAEQGDPSGVAVLFLHGLSDSWRSFERVLAHLPDAVHAFAVSQRGHGDSARPVAGYAMRDFAADAAAFMNAVSVEAAVVVGHSMGSLAARRFAIDYPERTSGVVLVGSFATIGNPGVTAVEAAVLTLDDPVDPAFVREFQESTLATPVPRTFFDTVVRESLKLPARVWRAAVTGILEDDTFAELDRVRAPALVVSGERDELCPRSDQEALAAAIADARLVVCPGAGHGLHWENPERFASTLVAYLRTVAP